MPYGLPKELDTPANNAKMERCVADVMAKGADEEKAIRICKTSIMNGAGVKTTAQKEPDQSEEMMRGAEMRMPMMRK